MIRLDQVKFIFRDLDIGVIDAMHDSFKRIPQFSASLGDIFTPAPVSAIISPANSFGIMDGGIDLAYTKYFGKQLPERLQQYIKTNFYGELPVGQAVIIPTINENIRYLISAPTMRIPQNVQKTANAFLAFRACLIAINEHNMKSSDLPIETVLCPGLATATGNLRADLCAIQIVKAYESIVGNNEFSWKELISTHYTMTGYNMVYHFLNIKGIV